MGVIKQGILGGFSGRVGGVVGSSWKGIAYMKTLPLSVANPKTAAQVAQRNSFSQSVLVAVQILSTLIKPLWDRFSVQMSGFNEFLQINIEKYDEALDNAWRNFIMSKGKMAATAIVTASIAADNSSAIVTWVDDSGSGLKLITDVPFITVVDVDGVSIAGLEGVSTRSSAAAVLLFPSATYIGLIAYVWLSFKRADGTIVSDSSVLIATYL